jgi:hypothetical protein
MGLQKDNIIDCKNCHREALAVATQHCFPGLLHCVRNDGEESLLYCVRKDGEKRWLRRELLAMTILTPSSRGDSRGDPALFTWIASLRSQGRGRQIASLCSQGRGGKQSTKNLAEREGFEPSIQVKLYNGLANRRLQPLGHPSMMLF